MICCKIIADYKTICQNFSSLFTGLSDYGSVLWDNHYFYFANTDKKDVTERTVKKILKKYGCGNAFIEKFSKDYQPSESDNANWWIEDKLIKISYVECEEECQQDMKFISQQLTDLTKIINNAMQTSQSQNSEEEKNKTEGGRYGGRKRK